MRTVILLLLLSAAPLAATAGEPPASRCADDLRRIAGLVLDGTRAPVEGAVVVSSAGGQEVTTAAGRYELEVALPDGTRSVRVTAIASTTGGSRAASVLVNIAPGAQDLSAGDLVLTEGTSCEPSWLPTFGGSPGVDSSVLCFAVHDDGSGPALYAGGAFSTAGGQVVHQVARWDGSSWSMLGAGTDGWVQALAVFDDGSGPALYAAGWFDNAGGVKARRIAKWDGASWSPLGSGLNTNVYALAAFDDGSGPALYVGGGFVTAGGLPANRIARWDGSTWSTLGTGMDNSVESLKVFDDGNGPALYAGGSFSTAGSTTVKSIAKWDGAVWSALGTGVSTFGVWALEVFDDGSGPALYAGGHFTKIGGVSAGRVARWNGTAWSPLGTGMNQDVYALTVFDDGSGPALFAAGAFTTAGGLTANRLARWDGSSWSAPDSGLSSEVNALAVFDSGSGAALFAGGGFVSAGGNLVNQIARWHDGAWSALGGGLNGDIHALAVFDDGSGPALYAGGDLDFADGVEVQRIARWDGSGWSALSGGVDDTVLALAVYDDGSGPALFAGGEFLIADGQTLPFLARWDGATWSAVGGGVNNIVHALAVSDHDGALALYAGGDFTLAGAAQARHIGRWDGTSWTALRGGVNDAVLAIATYDDGTGEALYVGGKFPHASGLPVSQIAKWDGSDWSALGTGINGFGVRALEVFDDGNGPALFAGGTFTDAGGSGARHIARWDGSAWSALGVNGPGSFSTVNALTVFDDGTGTALFAGGSFQEYDDGLGGITVLNRVGKWDGAEWSPLGAGMSAKVLAWAEFDAGDGPALFAGGEFVTVLDSGDSYLAQWAPCSGTPAWTDMGSSLPGTFGHPLLVGTGTLSGGSTNSVSLSNAKPLSIGYIFVAPSSTPLPFKGGTLLAYPVPVLPIQTTWPDGTMPIPFNMLWGVPADTEIWVQWAIVDPGAVQGIALSNAIRGLTP